MDTAFIKQVAREFLAETGLSHTEELDQTIKNNEELFVRILVTFIRRMESSKKDVDELSLARNTLCYICGHSQADLKAA
jgi:hypothetical protein